VLGEQEVTMEQGDETGGPESRQAFGHPAVVALREAVLTAGKAGARTEFRMPRKDEYMPTDSLVEQIAQRLGKG
jgi:hypothetical protein